MAEYVSKDVVRQMLGNRYGGFLLELDALPAADVVQITRCKGCVFSREPDQNERHINREALICTNSDFMDRGWNPVWPDDFCSHSQRKEPADERLH